MDSHALKVYFLVFVLPFWAACHSNPSPKTDGITGAYVQDFLRGEIRRLAPGTMYTRHNGKPDSSSILPGREKDMTAAFLSTGMDAPGWENAYQRIDINDSINHRSVVSYRALSDSTLLNTLDVYTRPGTKDIRKLYLQCILSNGDSSVRKQLIWETDTSFTLIISVDKHEYTSDLLQEKVIWKKP